MKVLIAEDDPIYRRLLEVKLREWGYEVLAASDGLTAWNLLQGEAPPRMAILDWMMPGMDGLHICEGLRGRREKHYTYLLLLTAKAQQSDLVQGLEAGADDFLRKPVDILELKARLQTGKRMLALQDQLIAAHEAMRLQATRDFLTGVWNRPAILEILEQELARAQREGQCFSLVLADIDYFKRVNDTYGHLVGDGVLKEVAHRMVSVSRPYDMVGRYGGEEFIVVLPGCDEARGLKFAERLREHIAEVPVTYRDQSIALTVSVGLMASSPSHPDSPAELLHAADMALYQAKAKGRNRVEAGTLPALPREALTPSTRSRGQILLPS